MSDIQRYCETPYGVSTDDEGTFIEYDDHIAEVEKWRAVKIDKDVEIGLKMGEIEKLQARIDELLNDPMTKHEYNKIKAEGIEEMCKKLYNEGKTLSEFNIKEYANKLRVRNEIQLRKNP